MMKLSPPGVIRLRVGVLTFCFATGTAVGVETSWIGRLAWRSARPRTVGVLASWSRMSVSRSSLATVEVGLWAQGANLSAKKTTQLNVKKSTTRPAHAEQAAEGCSPSTIVRARKQNPN